jgi:hypothetical protein
MSGADYLLPIVLGISLAAATGFRVFAPLLLTGLAMQQGYLPSSDTFAWAATTPALTMLAIAATAEVLAYYVPGIDNLLDTIATPAALLAGISVSAAVMTDLPPMLKWTLAIIAGGGAASLTQGATTALRGHSTIWTAGFGNAGIATAEIFGAVVLSVLAIAAPYVALLLFVLFCVAVYRLVRRWRRATSQ